MPVLVAPRHWPEQAVTHATCTNKFRTPTAIRPEQEAPAFDMPGALGWAGHWAAGAGQPIPREGGPFVFPKAFAFTNAPHPRAPPIYRNTAALASWQQQLASAGRGHTRRQVGFALLFAIW
jgi:hypothetical protein